MNATSIWQARSRTVRAACHPQGGRPGAIPAAREHCAKALQRLPARLLMVMTMLVAVAVAGCQERLAQRDSYFAPLRGLSTSLHAETEHVLDYHQAVHAALLGCGERRKRAAFPVASGAEGPMTEGASRDDAHARLCASSDATHAVRGAPGNAYRRWVEDSVRPLPAPSETASSIGGGS